MSLIAWYPLIDNFKDYSGQNHHLTQVNGSGITKHDDGQLGSCYKANRGNRSSLDTTLTKYDFTDGCSIFCWVYVEELVGDSANGVISNHSFSSERGMGITLKYRSSTTYSVCCNTGYVEGGRTYNALFGNIILNTNTWNHIGFTYNPTTKEISFYVNGELDTVKSIPSDKTMKFGESKLSIFSWSTAYNNSSDYRPGQRINDVRVYDHVVSAKEVYEIAKALVLHYNYNDYPSFNIPNIYTNTRPFIAAAHGANDGVTTEVSPPFPGVDVYKVSDNGADSQCVRINFNFDCDAMKLWNRWWTISIYVFVPLNFKDRVSGGTIEVFQNSTGTDWHSSNGYNSTYNFYGAGSIKISSKSFAANECGQWVRMNVTFRPLESKRRFVTADDPAENNKYVAGYFRIDMKNAVNNGTPYYFYVSAAQLELGDEPKDFRLPSNSTDIKCIDSSGLMNHGSTTLQFSPSPSKDSYLGSSSLIFTKDTYFTIPKTMKLRNSQSISFWFKRLDTNSSANGLYGGQFHGGETYKQGIMIGFDSNGNTMRAKFYGPTTKIDLISPTIELNKWYLYTLVYTPTSQKIYINGTVVATGSRQINYIDWTGVDTFFLGKTTDSVNRTTCIIDDFRIYASAISDDDVMTLYKSRASVSKSGELFVNEIVENISDNLLFKHNQDIINKSLSNRLGFYEQTHCKCYLTDEGVRIVRTPNLTHPGDGNVMWGGLRLQGLDKLMKAGRTYKLTFKCKGQSYNDMDIYLARDIGWSAEGGLGRISVKNATQHGTNFNSKDWIECSAYFTIPEDFIKEATTTEGSVTSGNFYHRTRQLKIGYGYTNTGSLGTDVYIKDLCLKDVTDGEVNSVNNQGQLVTEEAIELAGGIVAIKMSDNTVLPIYTEERFGETWARVFTHYNYAGTHLFTSENEANSVNIYDPMVEGKYSIMHYIDNFVDTKGFYEFLLLYPYDKPGGYNRWKQTSSPKVSTITGYSAISLTWTENGFGGLVKSTTSASTYDCNPGTSNWHYSIGTRLAWNGGIPAGNLPAITKIVELWVRLDLAKFKDRIIFSINRNGTTTAKEFIEI